MWCTLCDCTHDECNNSQIHASFDYTILLKLFVHQSQRQSQNHESAICGVRVNPHIKTTTFLVELHFHPNNLFEKKPEDINGYQKSKISYCVWYTRIKCLSDNIYCANFY